MIAVGDIISFYAMMAAEEPEPVVEDTLEEFAFENASERLSEATKAELLEFRKNLVLQARYWSHVFCKGLDAFYYFREKGMETKNAKNAEFYLDMATAVSEAVEFHNNVIAKDNMKRSSDFLKVYDRMLEKLAGIDHESEGWGYNGEDVDWEFLHEMREQDMDTKLEVFFL